MNFPKNASKQQKGMVLKYVAQFVEKNSFCSYLSPFTGLIKNSCLNKSKFSSGLHISNMVGKTNFLNILVPVSAIITFTSKKKSSLSISQKMLQNNRKAQFSSMWLTLWRKTFFFKYLSPFTGLIKKVFKPIQIFLRISPFQTW